MSTIKSSDEHLTLNADGTAKEIKLQANGVEKAKVTSTGVDVTGRITTDGITEDTSGNVGIGVTPEGWDTAVFKSIDGGGSGKIGSLFWQVNGDNTTGLSANVYYNGGWKYISTDEASLIELKNNEMRFKVAPSGTADANISWSEMMRLFNPADRSMYVGCTAIPQNGAVGMYYNGGTIHLGGGSTSGQDRMRFDNPNGRVGSIVTSGTSTAYNTSSDYRLKENVVPMSASIDRLKQLKPSRFNFIADADTTVDGFLAHEAQEVVPEAVGGEKDAMRMEEYEVEPAVKDDDGNVVTEAVMGEREVPDYQGIDQSKLVPLLTSALQEAVAKIEALEARIEALENA